MENALRPNENTCKGNTILQFCGIDKKLVPKAADRNPDKWG